MAGPGGVSVGRASIRILPDTSAFGRSLERYVQRIEKTLRIDIPTAADFKGFREDVDRAREEQQREPVDVPVKPVQLDDFQRRIQATVAKLSREAEVHIPATVEGEQMRRDLAAQIKGLEALLKVKVPVSLEGAAAFRQQVLAQLAEVEVMAKAVHPKVEVKVDVDRSIFQQMRSLEGALGLAKKAAEGAAGAVGGITDAGLSAIGALGKIPPIAYGIAAALTLAAPLAADLAVSLGPGLVVGLSALTGVGVAVGVLALGMGKLQKAFKPVLDGFDQMRGRIGDVLSAGLRPLVAEFVARAMPVLANGLSSIAGTLNGIVRDLVRWASSSDTLMLLGDLFHGLNEAFKPLRGAVVAVIDAIVRLATAGTPALRQINTVVAELAVRFDNFVKAGERSGSLPKLINDAVAAAGRLLVAVGRLGLALFNTFASIGKGSTGGFTTAIAAMATAVEKFNAGGGGAKIHDFLVKTGQALGQYFASGEFQRTVTDFRTFAVNVSDAIGPLAAFVRGVTALINGFRSLPGGGTIADAFGAAVNPIMQLIGVVNGLKDSSTGVAATWNSLTSTTASVWAAITGFVTSAWATITATISAAGASTVAGITSAWGAVTGFFTGLWASITSGVSTAWATVTSIISTATAAVLAGITAFVGILSGIWQAFWSNGFTQLVVAQVNLVAAVINLLGAVVQAVFLGMVAFVTTSVQGIVGAVTRAWAVVSAVTSVAWTAVAGFVSAAWSRITGSSSAGGSAVSGFVSAAWARVTSITSTAWSIVSSTVASWWNTIYGTVSSRAAAVWAVVASWFGRVASTIGDGFQRGYNAAVTWIGNLISEVAGLGAQILSAVAGFGTLLFNAGAQLIQGLINGITSKINAVTSAVNGIASKIRGFFPGSPVKEGPLVSWNNGGAGKRLVAMLVTGLSDTTDVESAMRSLAGKVASPLQASAVSGDAGGGGLLSAGTSVVVNVTNPVPETASESTTRIARKLALFGPVALPA